MHWSASCRLYHAQENAASLQGNKCVTIGSVQTAHLKNFYASYAKVDGSHRGQEQIEAGFVVRKNLMLCECHAQRKLGQIVATDPLLVPQQLKYDKVKWWGIALNGAPHPPPYMASD
jgi:hypothetical protein